MESLAKKFDEEIEKYIEEYEMDNEDSIKLEETFADLIIRNYKKPTEKEIYSSNKKLKDLSIDKSLLIAMEFLLKYYNNDYFNKFTYALNEIFVFDDNEEATCSFYDPNSNRIYLNLIGNIYDPIVIIHEFMHYVNSNFDVLSDASEYFTEAISYYNEFLVEDFIEEKYPSHKKELKSRKYTRELAMYIEAIEFKVCAHLLKVKQKGHKINRWFLQEAIEKISYVPESDIEDAFIDIKGTLEEGVYPDFGSLFEHLSQYVAADVFSKYLYALHKKNKNISIDINEVLKNYDVEDLFNFLDVETYREINEEIYNYREKIGDDFSIPIIINEKEQKKLEHIYKKQKRA